MNNQVPYQFDTEFLSEAIFHQLNQGDLFFSKLMQSLLKSVREQLHMEVAFVSEFTEGRRVFKFIDSAQKDAIISVGNSDPLDESYCQRIVDGTLPELIPDACQNQEACKLDVTQVLPVGAHVSVPLKFSDGEVYGTFCAFSRLPSFTLNARDLALMRVFASIAAAALEENRGEQAVFNRRKNYYESLMVNNRFVYYMQPIVNINNESVCGHELLLRIKGDDSQSPQLFLTEIDMLGLSTALNISLFSQVLDILKAVPSNQFLTWNLAPSVILDHEFFQCFYGQDLSQLVIEITEHAVIKNYVSLNDRLNILRQSGAKVAIDDAGAGYASLRHILQLKPDFIKLDHSLIHNIHREPELQALAESLVSFAEKSNAKLIAEGVEVEEEHQALQLLSFELGQGFYFARPAPDFMEMTA